MAINNHIH